MDRTASGEHGEELGAGPPRPSAPGERVDVLDALRGFALLGILLVNIEFFRGPALYALLAGAPPALGAAEEGIAFAVGWLAQGKFISSFAMLFGVGAAVLAERAQARGASPRGLLAKRYAWLALFGLAHMFLLFAGDILFIYGVAGFVLLAFAGVRAKTALWWALGLAAFSALMMALLVAAPEPEDEAADEMQAFYLDLKERVYEAYAHGGVGDQLAARAWESAATQGFQLFLLPWILALFLFGFSAWKSGLLSDRERRRRAFRRAALFALPAGLLLNLPLGSFGAFGYVGPETDAPLWQEVVGGPLFFFAAPLSAVGYLGALGLLVERSDGTARAAALSDLGRVALSGYILQSVLATGTFVWLGFYGQLTATQALVFVACAWISLLALARLYAKTGRRGPLEALWRRLTYGRRPR